MLTMQLPSVMPRQAWRMPLLTLFLLLALLLLGLHQTVTDMVTIWNRSATFTHAFVVPPIVAWLVWRARARVAVIPPSPAPLALLPMLGAAVLWLAGELTSTNAASQLALAAMLVLCVPLVLGWTVTRALLFPLLFLFFAVPIGEFMTPTLMRWTADVLVASLRATGIPVYQEGQQLVIPSGRWAVVEACSGIRYLMATFMVGSLFAYINYQSLQRRLVFVAVSLVMPVVANWVRAYIIVMLGHLSNNEIATGVDHLVYGWVFFGVVIMALFFIGARWAEDDSAGRLPPVGHVERPAIAGWTAGRSAALVVVGLAVMLWPLALLHGRSEPGGGAVQLRLPDRLGGWSAQSDAPVAGYLPHFVNPSATVHRTYRQGDAAVTVQIVYYRNESPTVKLVSSVNQWVLSGTHVWHVLHEGWQTVPAAGQDMSWREATVLRQAAGAESVPGGRVTVWRTYWLGDRLESRDPQARAWKVWTALRGLPDDGAAVHLSVANADDVQARRVLAGFASDNFALIQQILTDTRAGR